MWANIYVLQNCVTYAISKKKPSHCILRRHVYFVNTLHFVEIIFIAHKHIPRANYNKNNEI